MTSRGEILYDDQYGHVCSCTAKVERDDGGELIHTSFDPTVRVDRSVEPTQGGSWWYVCSRCGAGAWSGC